MRLPMMMAFTTLLKNSECTSLSLRHVHLLSGQHYGGREGGASYRGGMSEGKDRGRLHRRRFAMMVQSL